MIRIDNVLDTFNIDDPVFLKVGEKFVENEVLMVKFCRNGIFFDLHPVGCILESEQLKDVENNENLIDEEEMSQILEDEAERELERLRNMSVRDRQYEMYGNRS